MIGECYEVSEFFANWCFLASGYMPLKVKQFYLVPGTKEIKQLAEEFSEKLNPWTNCFHLDGKCYRLARGRKTGLSYPAVADILGQTKKEDGNLFFTTNNHIEISSGIFYCFSKPFSFYSKNRRTVNFADWLQDYEYNINQAIKKLDSEAY